MLRVWHYAVVVLVFSLRRSPRLEAARSEPDVIEDEYGNRADNDSNIRFVNYNGTVQYKTKASSLVGGEDGMLPFYRMARYIGKAGFCSQYPYGQ